VERSKFAQEVYELREELDSLKTLIEEARESVSQEASDMNSLLKADMDSRFENHFAYMDNLKEEMDLAHKRLCHERQEYQGHLLDVKTTL